MLPNANAADELTSWERINLTTRWGRYLTEIEQRSVLLGSEMAAAKGRALEVGCDGGRWSNLLAAQGWDAVCTDISPKAIEICQLRLPQAKCILVKETDTRLPCSNEAAELITCMEADAVVGSSWFVEEASRVLTPGGCLVATITNRASLRALFRRLQKSLSQEKPNGSRIEVFYQVTYSFLRERLKRSGFKIIDQQGYCWAPFPRASDSRFIPVFTRLERLSGLRFVPRFSPWVVFVAQKPIAGSLSGAEFL